MLIECRDCPMHGHQCDDCVVFALLAMPEPQRMPDPQRTHRDSHAGSSPPLADVDLDLDWAERAAVTRLVRSGLVSPATGASARAQRQPLSARFATG